MSHLGIPISLYLSPFTLNVKLLTLFMHSSEFIDYLNNHYLELYQVFADLHLFSSSSRVLSCYFIWNILVCSHLSLIPIFTFYVLGMLVMFLIWKSHLMLETSYRVQQNIPLWSPELYAGGPLYWLHGPFCCNAVIPYDECVDR